MAVCIAEQIEAKCADKSVHGTSRGAGANGAPVAHAAQFPQSSVRHAVQNDPLAHVKSLPMDQRMMLCALTASNGEEMRVPDIIMVYEDVCRWLRQPEHLVSNGSVVCALNALVDRGLLSLRAARRAASTRPTTGGRGRVSAQCLSDFMAELAVPCKNVRESIEAASPLLKNCLAAMLAPCAEKSSCTDVTTTV